MVFEVDEEGIADRGEWTITLRDHGIHRYVWMMLICVPCHFFANK